ncbi:hypothetical protein [Stackebrandtia nassauensis]|uniref:PE domain-containing protein n=1 Tax=Stackebrandtia nassauensis (strain DSM 44728 / CIP 108903 / NRRL B-16338 / NBRC 102104 / LLR-40K-21) TaxID=446470 RepID=D3QBN4_STANL|nr:hypothetical protein [Stackebrandtia nassauensis]ADD42916.1 hypothetical protein Snas_3246 [Stackebrandtia nassauensis DSM 44728]
MNDRPKDAVALDREDMFGLAEALRSDAERFLKRAGEINTAIGSGNTGHREDRAWGADPRNLSAQPIVEFHNELADRAHRLLESVGTGMSNLSGITEAIVARFGDQDALSSASVDDISVVTRLDPSSDQPPQDNR